MGYDFDLYKVNKEIGNNEDEIENYCYIHNKSLEDLSDYYFHSRVRVLSGDNLPYINCTLGIIESKEQLDEIEKQVKYYFKKYLEMNDRYALSYVTDLVNDFDKLKNIDFSKQMILIIED